VTKDVYEDFFTETVRSVLAFLEGAPIRVLAGPGASAPAATVSRQYENTR